ncbi:F-box/kelch-repeat protein At3g06240-like [Solanum stenotomum]|uniref:F-box/kelch-repeat protein At3g06240-like n=1 Tax=Solanum stenotomum TaxID=172797 RepID=UPI0020D1460E|nr:F-box/kelch-repeat protein At3g06240-like [Solanum stenotomum]
MPVMDVKSSVCKGSRISHHVTRIMDLPWVIMIEILSRLPIKPIFRCRAICKLWYRLLTSDPLFFNMHQTRSLNFRNILFLDGQCNPFLLELKAEYDYYVHRCNRTVQVTPKFHFHPRSAILVGYCNGFICLVGGLMHIENHSVYINNPLLGEYFKLELPKWEISVTQVAYGFCFSEVSGEYKVLRLVDRQVQDDTRASELEANVNGALHWMDSEKTDSIYSFDVETEKIKYLPAPPGLETPSSNLRLAELGNCLCLIDISTYGMLILIYGG